MRNRTGRVGTLLLTLTALGALSIASAVGCARSGTSVATSQARQPEAAAATTAPARATAAAAADSPDESGARLHQAVLLGRPHEALELIREGADVNHPVPQRKTGTHRFSTLLFTASYRPDMADVATALVVRGADLEFRGISGFTPLHNACCWANLPVAEVLLAAGADVHARADADGDGATPLHFAALVAAIRYRSAEGDRVKLCEALLSAGADPRAKDSRGRTPLDWAEEQPFWVSNWNIERIRRERREVVRLLAGGEQPVEPNGAAAQPEADAPAAPPPNGRAGLDAAWQERLDTLLAAQGDPAEFERLLRDAAASGEYGAVVALTHAMFELPWVEAQRPQGRGDTRMPKLAVEGVLDDLVAVTEHDQLSAGYFRALKGRGDVDEAKAKLIDWTVRHRDLLLWNGTRFIPKE